MVCLRKLFLRRHVKITLRDGKLFHVALRIHILNTLINVVYRSSVFLVLRCRQVLKFSKGMFLVYDCVAYQVLTRGRRACMVRLILIYTIRLALLERLLVLVFEDAIGLCALEVDVIAWTLEFRG